MFFFQNLTAELFLLESPDDSYFPKSGGSTFLKTVGSHFSEICGNKVTAYTRSLVCGITVQFSVAISTGLSYSLSCEANLVRNRYGKSPIFRTDCKFLPFRTEKWPFSVRIRVELFHHPFTTFCGAFSLYESLCLQLCKLLLYRLG